VRSLVGRACGAQACILPRLSGATAAALHIGIRRSCNGQERFQLSLTRGGRGRARERGTCNCTLLHGRGSRRSCSVAAPLPGLSPTRSARPARYARVSTRLRHQAAFAERARRREALPANPQIYTWFVVEMHAPEQQAGSNLVRSGKGVRR
jgi:hypothetical protein